MGASFQFNPYGYLSWSGGVALIAGTTRDQIGASSMRYISYPGEDVVT